MLQDDKGELKRGADELVVHYFEYTDTNGVARRAYATDSLDGDIIKANLLLSLRELRSVEYLPRLSPELRALVQKARRAPRLTANPTQCPLPLPFHPPVPRCGRPSRQVVHARAHIYAYV